MLSGPLRAINLRNVSSSGRTHSVTAPHSGSGRLARPLLFFASFPGAFSSGSPIVSTRSRMPPAPRPRGRAGGAWRIGLATAHQRIILFQDLRVAHHFDADEQFKVA
jgi:hypothetical protein